MRASFQYAIFDWIGSERPSKGGCHLIREVAADA
jgi:hypothetical protein